MENVHAPVLTRKVVYGLIAAVAGVAVAYGVIGDGDAARWLPVVEAGLGAAASVLACWKARRVDYTMLYGGFAALNVALGVAAVLSDGQVAAVDGLLAQLAVFVPALVAFVRTDVSDEAGDPDSRVVARYAK